jgi:hypothetical protein
MPHVKLTRDIGRGHHNGKGLFLFVDLGREVAFFAPVFINALLKLARGVGFGQLALFDPSSDLRFFIKVIIQSLNFSITYI